MGHRRLVRRGSRDNRHQRVGDGTAFPDTQLVSLRKTSLHRSRGVPQADPPAGLTQRQSSAYPARHMSTVTEIDAARSR